MDLSVEPVDDDLKRVDVDVFEENFFVVRLQHTARQTLLEVC